MKAEKVSISNILFFTVNPVRSVILADSFYICFVLFRQIKLKICSSCKWNKWKGRTKQKNINNTTALFIMLANWDQRKGIWNIYQHFSFHMQTVRFLEAGIRAEREIFGWWWWGFLIDAVIHDGLENVKSERLLIYLNWKCTMLGNKLKL